jgi:hypothetical protein
VVASGLLAGVPCQVILKKKACKEDVLANLPALAAALLKAFSVITLVVVTRFCTL